MTTNAEREEIIGNIARIVKEKFINPNDLNQDLNKWAAQLEDCKDRMVAAADEESFVGEVRAHLRKLGASHTAFFHGGGRGVPAPHAIHATLSAFDTQWGRRWVLQDVIEDGVAFRAGLQPGDIILTQDAQDLTPPHAPEFSLGERYLLSVVGRNGSGEKTVEVSVPAKAAKGRPPTVEPKSISQTMLDGGIGLLKVASFPGASGRGFAVQSDAAIRSLVKEGCSRLILDLRGNVGGGLGSLRLMSYLTPASVPVGYSVTRAKLRKGFLKESLPRITKIPSSRFHEILMAIRFGLLQKDRSIALFTEGLGAQPFHGRIALLVNEHTHSAAEMVAAFAEDNRLGVIGGAPSAGEVLGGANFRVGGEYRVRLPIAAWYTWSGRTIEGKGVPPSIHAEAELQSLRAGMDRQLEAVKSYVKQL
jgi:carboxyl-terminal processing protease